MVAFASSLDQAGVLARSAQDCALLLSTLCGPDPDRDSTSLDVPAEDFHSKLARSVAGLRIGVPAEFFGAGLDSDVRQAVEAALQEFVRLGTTLVPISLRGAIEHHSHRGDPGFANEYRVWIPLFNLNRHVHHHEEPTVPWYLLEYRTHNPLHEWNYVTHWVNVYLRREFVLMQPMRKGPRREMPSEP